MAFESLRLYRRGDIVQARFDPTQESEQSGVRPAVVVSPDSVNARSPVLILAPLTTRNTERLYPHEALLEAGDGVPRRSKVLLMQLRAMSKARILNHYGSVAPQTMQRIDSALQIAVGLEKL